MKVIFPIENSTMMGGAQHSTLALIDAFRKRGHDVVTILPLKGGMHDELKLNKIQVGNGSRWRFSSKSLLGSIVDCMKVSMAIRRAIASPKDTILYANGIVAFLYSWLGSRFLGSPVRIVFHERGFACYPLLLLRLTKFIVNNKSAILITTSEGAAKKWIDVGVESSRIRVVYNGINPQAFLPKTKCESDQIVVGMVARFSRNKGHADFIQSAKLLLSTRKRCTFLIVGDVGVAEDDIKYKYEIYDMAHKLGISDHVIFVGGVTYSNMADSYEKMDIFVNPAPLEPFGRSIVEAMMCGLPVVATAAGGPLEIVKEGVTGFLVPPSDPGALMQKLTILVADESLRLDMGRRGRERGLALFNEENCVSQAVQVCLEPL
ncbi:MAG: glycosyltransferase family 4 protein [Verrucomicrobia bacterium]|nr:glycosyltransferase family 4 protein [Verrucomicrobiota bacterium]